MKKLFMVLCVVIMFFGIVGCPSPDESVTNSTSSVVTKSQVTENPGGSEPSPVPEPATLILLGCGLVGLAGVGRKKFFKKD